MGIRILVRTLKEPNTCHIFNLTICYITLINLMKKQQYKLMINMCVYSYTNRFIKR